MRIKPSAGLLAGGLSAMAGGALVAGISITDAYGVTQHPLWLLGLVTSVAGLVMFIVGMFRLGRNVDLAAAKIVDGLEAPELRPRSFAERRDARIAAAQR